MIDLKNINYRSLHIDSLAIPRGITTIIGPNGSGKTTLLRLVAGIVVPESGEIRVDSKSPRTLSVGWINEFPDKNILFSRVSDEIASAPRFNHTACDETEEMVRRIAGTFNIRHLLPREICTLSGGEKVLVALAAAFVNSPDLIVLDEYDSHLDATSCALINRVIQQSGISYVIRCTQQMETAARSDRVIFLQEGQIKYAGSPEHVFTFLSGTRYYPLSWRCPV